MFLVNCYLLHPSHPASTARGWLIDFILLELALQYIAMTRNNQSIIWISLVGASQSKGQLISKANCQAVDSPKKTNEWICFFWLEELLCSEVKCLLYVFFGESTARRFVYDFNLPLEFDGYSVSLEACEYLNGAKYSFFADWKNLHK